MDFVIIFQLKLIFNSNRTFTPNRQIDMLRWNESSDWMRKLERNVSKYRNVVTHEIKLLRAHREWECVTQWLAAWIEVCCSHDPFTTLTKLKCSRRVRFCCGSALFIFCFAATVIVLVRSLSVSVSALSLLSLSRSWLCSRSLCAIFVFGEYG